MLQLNNYMGLLVFILMSLQSALGSQTQFYLDYRCIGINASSGVNIVTELIFFTGEGILKGDPNSIKGIALTDSVGEKPIEPVAGEQSLFDCNQEVNLKRGMSPLGTPVKNYVALRLAGVSPTLALELSDSNGEVVWGMFKIKLKTLTRLEQTKKDQISYMFDFISSFFNDGKLYYITDGEVVRIVLLNDESNEVLWEGVLDSRNFHDPSFNRLVKDLFLKTQFPLGCTQTDHYKFLILDRFLQTKLNINWINPVQIKCLTDIHPLHTDKN